MTENMTQDETPVEGRLEAGPEASREAPRPRPLPYSRIVLGLVVLYALVRLIDPYQRWARLQLGGDRVEHAVVAYLITLGVLAAFPRVRLWIPAIAMSCLGALTEAIQAHPQIVGAAQPGDIVANAAGAVIATVPIWLFRRGRAERT